MEIYTGGKFFFLLVLGGLIGYEFFLIAPPYVFIVGEYHVITGGFGACETLHY
jgi:hypothetical protein